ncbi:MAG TPA: hypothetical protein ENK70_07995 [Methylophaga sp.]|nr:hypothetical protein [Methylophaga sp.]
MADITNSGVFYQIIDGGLKVSSWKISDDHNVTSQDTIDFGTDTAGGRINRIQHALITPMDGTVIGGSGQIQALFSGTTGIVTIPAEVDSKKISLLVIGE